MLKTKKLPWQPLLFSILKVSSCQTLPGLSISENFTEANWRKLKSKPNRRQKWRCLSSFNLRLKALISEVNVEQQILALVCYVSVALIRKIAKRTRILTFDWGHWRALRDLAWPYWATFRTFARKFSNIDFFLKILPLKNDELVMSEM